MKRTPKTKLKALRGYLYPDGSTALAANLTERAANCTIVPDGAIMPLRGIHKRLVDAAINHISWGGHRDSYNHLVDMVNAYNRIQKRRKS